MCTVDNQIMRNIKWSVMNRFPLTNLSSSTVNLFGFKRAYKYARRVSAGLRFEQNLKTD